jgi:hypothetical protein
MSLSQTLVIVLGGVGITWYYFCLLSVGLRPTSPGRAPTSFREFESLSIATISVSFATFVGGLLGSKGAAAQAAGQPVDDAQFAVDGLGRLALWLSVDNLQVACAVVYILSLLIAAFFWRKQRDAADPAITNLARSLLGFIAGAFAVLFEGKP